MRAGSQTGDLLRLFADGRPRTRAELVEETGLARTAVMTRLDLFFELGLITPPIGMNVFVIKGMAKDVPLETIFRGVTPFIIAQIILIFALIAFPGIALWLPSTMAQ